MASLSDSYLVCANQSVTNQWRKSVYHVHSGQENIQGPCLFSIKFLNKNSKQMRPTASEMTEAQTDVLPVCLFSLVTWQLSYSILESAPSPTLLTTPNQSRCY